MNDQVAAYRDLVESLAAQLVRTRYARQHGAEYDDLAQMGLIAVWEALEKGTETVGADYIRGRMRNYIRWCAAKTRQPIPIEDLLRLDEELVAAP